MAARQYDHISADGNARQQNGDTYNTTTNHYHAPQTEKQSLGLLHAALDGNLGRIKFLVEQRGVDFETEDDDGLTALHCAAWSGFQECVEYLMQKGAYVHHRSDVYGSPLTLAALRGQLDLFDGPFKLDNIKAGASAFTGGRLGSPLHALLMRKMPSLAQAMDQILQLLLEAGAPINSKEKIYWDLAKRVGRTLLPRRGSTPMQMGKFILTTTPLHLAVQAWPHLIDVLLRYGADVNAQQSFNRPPDHIDGATPLMLACGVEAFSRLLERPEIDSHHQDSRGCNASMWAAATNSYDILERMLEQQMASDPRCIDCVNKAGETSLITAAARGHVNCVDVLLRRGCRVDVKDKSGRTALMHATERGHDDCVTAIKRSEKERRENGGHLSIGG